MFCHIQATIAKLSGAKITCVNVTVVSATLVAAVTDYQKYLTGQAQKILDSAKESCEKQGIQFASEVLNGGSPASKIAEFAEKQNVDLVIVGSKGLGGIRGKILGSVPSSLVHESSVSVLVVK